MPYLIAIGYALLGNAMIYAGIAFINAQLLPAWLGPVYDTSEVWHRAWLMLVLALPANFLFSAVFRSVPPMSASMVIIATLVVVLAAKSLLLAGQWPSARLLVAIAAVLASCLWVIREIQHA